MHFFLYFSWLLQSTVDETLRRRKVRINRNTSFVTNFLSLPKLNTLSKLIGDFCFPFGNDMRTDLLFLNLIFSSNISHLEGDFWTFLCFVLFYLLNEETFSKRIKLYHYNYEFWIYKGSENVSSNSLGCWTNYQEGEHFLNLCR